MHDDPHRAEHDARVEAEEPEAIREEGNRANGHDETVDVPLIQHLTEVGNAKRFALQHRGNALYCERLGGWYIWDGRRYQHDDTGAAVRLAQQTTLSIYQEVELAADKAERKRIADHAHKSESAARIDAMLRLARADRDISVKHDVFDRDPFLFNVLNGTIDLRTGELRPHRRDDLITKLAPITYDPGAECPLWRQSLGLYFDGNTELERFFQRAAGYSMTGDVSEQCLFFPYGSGENGKDTSVETLRRLAGDYGREAPPDLLMMHRNEQHPTGLADLCGARFVVSIELEEGRRLAEALVKKLTGSPRQKGRYMRADFFEFRSTHKLWLIANHRPVIRGTDHAIWRRFHVLPFNVRIPDKTKILNFAERLNAELPGILNWAVEGCLDWQRDGLDPPKEVQAATNEYRTKMDVLGDFLDECCITDDPAAETTIKDLYDAYKRWCDRTGESVRTQRAFGDALTERGFKPEREGRARLRRGIRLKPTVVTQ